MELKLSRKINNPTIIEGFPGFGLVGTIATEFLIDHLETEFIGKYWFEDMPPSIAIHESKVVHPLGIHYNKKYNLIIVHSISATVGIEYKAAEIIDKIAKDTKAKEIISIEGVGSPAVSTNEPRVFYFSKSKKAKLKLERSGVSELKEGIILGVTSGLILKSDATLTCLFAETQSQLPDSKAAAKVIEVLDKYIGLKVDYKPLIKQAEKFEEKLKGLMEKSQAAMSQAERKQLNYVG